MNIFVSSSVDTCLVVATSHVAALWGNREDAVDVNSRHVTSVVAVSLSNLFSSPNLCNFFSNVILCMKNREMETQRCVSNSMTNGD